jgi:hypothetical protein
MRKIDNFEEVKELRDQTLTEGPQIVVIKKVEDVTEKEYLRIEFDIANGDLKGMFQGMFEQTGVWSNTATMYKSYKQSALPYFKRFIVAVEKSNDNFKFDFDEQKLVGKYFVVNYGIEEYERDGEIKEGLKPVEARSVQSFKEGKIEVPKAKRLERTNATQNKTEVEIDEDLPF